MRTCNTRIQNCAARTANIKVEFGVVRSGYFKKEQIHGGGAGKQEIHIRLRVGNVSKKINTREAQQKEELLHIFKSM